MSSGFLTLADVLHYAVDSPPGKNLIKVHVPVGLTDNVPLY